MRVLMILSCCLFVQVALPQCEGKLVSPSTDLGGTVFANYEDAAVFLRGMIEAESDNYGNLTLYRHGTARERTSYRLTDVKLVAMECPPSMNMAGGEVGPRLAIMAKCISGPCILDPASPDLGRMQEDALYYVDLAKGRKVYSTLLIMQRFLMK